MFRYLTGVSKFLDAGLRLQYSGAIKMLFFAPHQHGVASSYVMGELVRVLNIGLLSFYAKNVIF